MPHAMNVANCRIPRDLDALLCRPLSCSPLASATPGRFHPCWAGIPGGDTGAGQAEGCESGCCDSGYRHSKYHRRAVKFRSTSFGNPCLLFFRGAVEGRAIMYMRRWWSDRGVYCAAEVV